MQLPPPKNSTALALYLLLTQPLYGVSQYEAVVSDKFFKFSTRVSDLALKHQVSIHKKREDGKNRFNHPYQNTRYCLYSTDLHKNIQVYNEINK
jgi:hypothetical protein